MLKSILPLFFALIFAGCVTNITPKPNIKVFEEEDTYILFALRAEQLKEHSAASSIFNTLYEKSHKKEYLYKSLQNDLEMGSCEDVVLKIDKILEKMPNNFILIRMKIIALIQLNKLELAKENALKLVLLSQEVDDYILTSEIYIKQKKFNTAIKYLESAYTKNYNEKILDKMSIVLYVNLQRKKDAIAQLETHLMVHGTSIVVCNRLIGFYSNDNNIDGLLSTYLRLYEINKNNEISKRIIQIYGFKQEHFKLMSFLEKSKSDDKVLFELYVSLKNYKKASQLGYKLHMQTGDIYYLGQSAIFEYESSKNKDNKEMLLRVVKTLKTVIENDNSPLYLNYLGYLMVDHTIDIEEGMEYINRALVINPNSAYYLDSLAWGYYKLNKCKEANKLMKKIRKLKGGDEPEVIEHEEKINQCLKNKKGKK